MESRSDLTVFAEADDPARARHSQRRHYRYGVRSLTYVKVDSANGGVLRDVSESGLAMQAVAPLRPHQNVHLRFELPNPRVRVEVEGRVAWTDSLGQAGVEFLELPPRSRRLLKEWLFTQVLVSAHRVLSGPDDSAAGLLFSASPRPAIRLETHRAASSRVEHQPLRVRLLWWPISQRVLSRLVDGLAILCAVLLFAVIVLATINILPSWPVALALSVAVAVALVALYWLVFVVGMGHTPGQRLARLACAGAENRRLLKEQESVRFR